MNVNVVRGHRMRGLVGYLVGPGRANEHTEPHLVGGDAALLTWFGDDELGRDAAGRIAAHVNAPQEMFGVDVPGGHVWHCSLSLAAREGLLTDDQWGQIAGEFVAAMEFDDNQGTKAPCRWVAIRHGVSTSGNDHVHLVVNLVREDGTKASVHNDYRRAQAAARALEVAHGLEQLESARAERATRGYHPAEREAQARARARAKYEHIRAAGGGRLPGWEQLGETDRRARITAELRADQPRFGLSIRVRGCATASRSEAEFVRRLRRAGLLVRPRYADGRTDVIVGYSVAERPVAGERPIWYGGGHLARDLTLPRLRDGWPDTPTGASEAAAEWNAAKRGRRVVAPGREAREPDPGEWQKRSTELASLVDTLRAVDLDDRDTWATVARQTAGALAAWSNAVEETPGDLAAAAEALSRSAQTYRRTVRPTKAGLAAISGTAMLLASATRGGQGAVAQAVLIRQFVQLTQAVHDAARAAGQKRYADLLAGDIRQRLNRVRAALPTPPNEHRQPGQHTPTAGIDQPVEQPALDPETQVMLDRVRASQARPATVAVSPVPTTIEAARPRQATRPGPDRGLER